MGATMPIKDRELLKSFMMVLKSISLRDYTIVYLTQNTGLRTSDVLPRKVSDFRLESGRFRSHLEITERKTGKRNKIAINDGVKRSLKEYIEILDLKYDDYLFTSRKKKNGNRVPVGRTMVYRNIRKAADLLSIDHAGNNIGRKNFAHFLNIEAGVATVSKCLNHSSPAVTMRYLGLDQEAKDEVFRNFEL